MFDLWDIEDISLELSPNTIIEPLSRVPYDSQVMIE